MEAKDPKSTESSGAQSTETKDPKSDATSSETLSEVEQTEKVSDASEGGAGDTAHSPAPSPDGAFDEGRASTSGIDDAGPM